MSKRYDQNRKKRWDRHVPWHPPTRYWKEMEASSEALLSFFCNRPKRHRNILNEECSMDGCHNHASVAAKTETDVFFLCKDHLAEWAESRGMKDKEESDEARS